MSTHNRGMMIILVLVLVSATTVQMVSATGEVTWHLRNDAATGFNYPSEHEYDLIINRESPTSGTATWFKFGPGNESWWYANYSAECNLTFPSGEWNVTFKTKLPTGSPDKHNYTEVHLWRLFENGTATEIVNSSTTIDTISEKWRTVLIEADTIGVKEGERIAISFKWSSDATGQVWIGCDSTARDSTLTSPPNSPVWPVPELSTLVLLSTGLLILAGYAYMGRRNK